MIDDHPTGRPALLPALAAMTWLQALVALALFAPGAVAPTAHLDVSSLSIFSTAVFAVGVFTSFWGGSLIARLGSFRTASLCAAAVAASMALATSGSGIALLAAGLCLGLAFGPETPASTALLGRLVTAERRAFVFSVRQTGNQIGAVCGSLALPAIAIWLAPQWSYAAVGVCAIGGIILFEWLRPQYADLAPVPVQVTPGVSLRAILATHMANGETSELDLDTYINAVMTQKTQTHLLSDGRTVFIRRQATPEGGWIASHEDITEQKRIETSLIDNAAELEHMNVRFDAAINNMTQGLCMFDGDQKVLVSNVRYAKIYGLSRDQVKVGTSLREILEFRRENGTNFVLSPDAYINENVKKATEIHELADGRIVSIARHPMQDGGWLTTHEDITDRAKSEKQIAFLAQHDLLTGLPNRAEFNARLEEASKRVKRYGGAITVMMLDLDKFKAVNDTLGHPAGDKLLVEVAQRLRSSIRETDLLARLGGDEFAIMQEGGHSQHEDAIALALRIIAAITQPFDLDGHQANIGTSIGIALAPEHGVEPQDLLKRADLALYRVKDGGRNDFRIFQPEMLEAAQTLQTAECDLRDAIEREEFELYYQPVMNAKTRTLCGVEALIRWRHPTRGLIGPDHFLPVAESTGLIVPIGDWVLQQACADAASWPAHIKIAVNISAVQFKKGNLFDVILCTLVETGLAPDRLELEITETALLENQEGHLAVIRQLKNLGISIALDDFGTGYSSVNYLTVFPFDKIKIDKSFTQDVLNRRDYRAVVASTLALAQGLGTVTTAEGVETEAQLEYMREAGVDFVQGYLLGRPVAVSQLDFLNANLPKDMVA